ncbi:MAG: alpha/beta fold hydrolase [Bacteroidia bacterium]
MKRFRKISLRVLLISFIILNISAAFHAWHFTHFVKTDQPKTKLDELQTVDKVKLLFFGLANPRPQNLRFPDSPYETFKVRQGEHDLEVWRVPVDSAHGEVILFHGYSGEKSSMLDRAKLIQEMGYNTWLVDFYGSGGSSGNTTSIGYREAEDVVAVIDFVKKKSNKRIMLLGTSMGAAAIMRAAHNGKLSAERIVIECPFGSMLQTSKNRFNKLGAPSFPAAHLLVFWGGIENGFWGFSHNPKRYAESVDVPSLLIYGEQDDRVTRHEIDAVYERLAGKKQLVLLPKAGHANYLQTEKRAWQTAVANFLRE